MNFFDIGNTAFTLLGYQISWLELVGTIFNLVCVILAARRKILNWPIGLVGVVLFMVLFYQIQLYADFGLQIFFFITGIIGWIQWSRIARLRKQGKLMKEVAVTTNTTRKNLVWLGSIIVAAALMILLLANIHTLFPTLFPLPAALPVLDGITAVLSIAGQILLMQRKLESWYLWLIVDVLSVGMYWAKAVPFVTLLYVIFTINALYGLREWRKEYKRSQKVDDEPLKERL
jgi:nicotinamide mononucleotide transporter